jgi:hypothetical protein
MIRIKDRLIKFFLLAIAGFNFKIHYILFRVLIFTYMVKIRI